jgi:PhoPQ-activated pathogenicity-related protein
MVSRTRIVLGALLALLGFAAVAVADSSRYVPDASTTLSGLSRRLRHRLDGTATMRAPATDMRPLYEYVNRTDDTYTWFDTKHTFETDLYSAHVLNMTSQTWLSPAEVANGGHIWSHKIVMLVPRGSKPVSTPDTVAVYVTKGKNNNPDHFPNAKDIDIVSGSLLLLNCRCIVAVLYQIPNQPMLFVDDPLQRSRTEDAAVAYTWRMAVERRTPEWAIYFPMTKAVERAMDTVTAWSTAPGTVAPAPVSKFFISGASKRGATTWLSGAFQGWLPASERRVIGIAPQVFSALQLDHTIPRIFESLGNWTFALEDYRNENVTDMIGTADMDYLVSVVDPLSYVDELKNIPVLAVNAANDEFFLPDDDWSWWHTLQHGQARRLMLPNAEHSMATRALELAQGISAYYTTLARGLPLPQVSWHISGGTINATTNTPPVHASMYSLKSAVTSPQRRDFRMVRAITPTAPCTAPGKEMDAGHCLLPYLWTKTDLKRVPTADSNEFRYEHTAEAPADGSFLAYFFEFQYGVPGTTQRLSFTTQVAIVPDVMPFQPCGKGADCHGDLV